MEATRKVPQGKLLRLRAELKAGKLVNPKLSGDFFLMPSDKLGLLEQCLEGKKPKERELIARALSETIMLHGIELAGISAQDIAIAAGELK